MLQVMKASLFDPLVLIQTGESGDRTADPERVVEDDEDEEKEAPPLLRVHSGAEEKV